jgi:hypothetical protein
MHGRIAGITVPGVCRSMGIEPTKWLMWSVGQIVVKEYIRRYGAPPPKDNRKKTYDEGVHCFAIYEEHMRKFIEKVINEHLTEKARQGDLFS